MNAAHIIVPICAFLYFTKAEIHKSQKSPQTIENHIMEVLYMHHENTNLLNEGIQVHVPRDDVVLRADDAGLPSVPGE